MQTIDIDGLDNVRADSVPTPWLVRSGTTESLTRAGTAALTRLGVGLVLDLREPDETGRPPHDLPVVPLPLYGHPAPRSGRLEDIYDGLLHARGTVFATAVGIIAEADGAVLVHCTAGKDRTGLLTALTLGAAGVDTEVIAADYTRSGPSVRPAREATATRIADAAPPGMRAEILRLHLESPREAIDHALGTLAGLGGAADYLRRHGLTEAQLLRLRAKAGHVTRMGRSA